MNIFKMMFSQNYRKREAEKNIKIEMGEGSKSEFLDIMEKEQIENVKIIEDLEKDLNAKREEIVNKSKEGTELKNEIQSISDRLKDIDLELINLSSEESTLEIQLQEFNSIKNALQMAFSSINSNAEIDENKKELIEKHLSIENKITELKGKLEDISRKKASQLDEKESLKKEKQEKEYEKQEKENALAELENEIKNQTKEKNVKSLELKAIYGKNKSIEGIKSEFENTYNEYEKARIAEEITKLKVKSRRIFHVPKVLYNRAKDAFKNILYEAEQIGLDKMNLGKGGHSKQTQQTIENLENSIVDIMERYKSIVAESEINAEILENQKDETLEGEINAHAGVEFGDVQPPTELEYENYSNETNVDIRRVNREKLEQQKRKVDELVEMHSKDLDTISKTLKKSIKYTSKSNERKVLDNVNKSKQTMEDKKKDVTAQLKELMNLSYDCPEFKQYINEALIKVNELEVNVYKKSAKLWVNSMNKDERSQYINRTYKEDEAGNVGVVIRDGKSANNKDKISKAFGESIMKEAIEENIIDDIKVNANQIQEKMKESLREGSTIIRTYVNEQSEIEHNQKGFKNLNTVLNFEKHEIENTANDCVAQLNEYRKIVIDEGVFDKNSFIDDEISNMLDKANIELEELVEGLYGHNALKNSIKDQVFNDLKTANIDIDATLKHLENFELKVNEENGSISFDSYKNNKEIEQEIEQDILTL